MIVSLQVSGECILGLLQVEVNLLIMIESLVSSGGCVMGNFQLLNFVFLRICKLHFIGFEIFVG